ncbi:MAG: hypothetical protein JNK84_18725 [Phreatobacter sp.]|uniref:hypothetical protein n=1 Tax=Phreatobacter sp. TaxID=1966341 RepID=UPI001A549794|nr:hypothetical protein [Phreatobacter sp.]MBL8571112.1 hypothetical protein [Phreatobacter sp.]
MKSRAATVLSAAVLALVLSSSAEAQTVCAEGRTREGKCVSAALASAARIAAIVYGQTRLSFSMLPILPSQDHALTDPTMRRHVGREVSAIHP